MKNYFVYFDTFNKNDFDFQFYANSDLGVGDILNFINNNIYQTLLEEYKTYHFLIKQRMFVIDEDLEETGGIFNILVEPIKL